MRDGLAINRMISRITRLPNKNAGKMVERAFIRFFLSQTILVAWNNNSTNVLFKQEKKIRIFSFGK